MEKYKITNSLGHVVYSSIDSNCDKCIAKCPLGKSVIINSLCDGKKRRRYLSEDKIGQLYYCTDDLNYIKSNRLFSEKIFFLNSILPFIENIIYEVKTEVTKENKRLLHNVTSLNGHNIQELYSVVDQNLLSHEFHKQKEIIIDKIKAEPEQAARMFLRIAKNNLSMKTEFAVFKKLLNPEPYLTPKSHNLRKVL